jgi:hypothetical protein
MFFSAFFFQKGGQNHILKVCVHLSRLKIKPINIQLDLYDCMYWGLSNEEKSEGNGGEMSENGIGEVLAEQIINLMMRAENGKMFPKRFSTHQVHG